MSGFFKRHWDDDPPLTIHYLSDTGIPLGGVPLIFGESIPIQVDPIGFSLEANLFTRAHAAQTDQTKEA